tara:strand:+ start:286 stop:1098 length:813 start_codon:yes stop_codon:yes gene_type:complete
MTEEEKVKKMYAKQDPETQKMMKTAIQNSSEKHPPLRNETEAERVERMMFLFEDGDKPKHYDDPLIHKVDTYQDFGKLREKASELQDQKNLKTGKPVSKEFIREAYPKKFDHFDKSTYPSTGKPQGKLDTWDLIKKTAKTPFEKKEIRSILHREYKKDKTRLEPDELRMIYKHPDQLKAMSEIKAQPVKTTTIFKLDEPYRTTPTPIPQVSDYIRTQTVIKPGLSEDFLALRSEIKKNYDYVMGHDTKKERSQKVESADNNTTTEETDDA